MSSQMIIISVSVENIHINIIYIGYDFKVLNDIESLSSVIQRCEI